MSIAAGSVVATLDLDTRAFRAGIRTAERDLAVFQRRIGAMGTGNISGLTRSFAGLNAVVGALTLAGFVKGTVNAGEGMIALQRRLELVAASVNKTGRETTSAAEQLEWLSQTALSTGTDFDGLSKAWVKLATTAHGAGVSLADLREGIEGTIGAGAAMGVSADGLNKVFNAMSQVGGKGQLYLEELKQQMGEHLPLAMQITARGLGVTTAELMAMTKKGKISANEFFEAWAKGSKEFQQFGPLLASTFTGQLQNFKTIWRTEVGGLVNDSGVSDALAGLTSQFNDAFRQITQDARKNSDDIGEQLINAVETAVDGVHGLWEEFGPVVRDMADAGRTIINGTLTSYNSLPQELRTYGLVGLLLLGKLGVGGGVKGILATAGLAGVVANEVMGAVGASTAESGADMIAKQLGQNTLAGPLAAKLTLRSTLGSDLSGKLFQGTADDQKAMVAAEMERRQAELDGIYAQLDAAGYARDRHVEMLPRTSGVSVLGKRRDELLPQIEALRGVGQYLDGQATQLQLIPPTGSGTLDPARQGARKAREARGQKIDGIELGDGASAGMSPDERRKLLSEMNRDLNEAVERANALRDSFLHADDALAMLQTNGAEFAVRRADEEKRIAAGFIDQRAALFTLNEAEITRKALAGDILRFQEHQARLAYELASLADPAVQAEGDKVFKLESQVSVTRRLLDAARELAQYDDKAIQAANAQLRLDQLRLDTRETMTRASDYFRPEFRGEMFANEKANADLDLSRMYYEYSLSMEQRLQLSRADGIRGFVDTASSGFAAILTGQRGISDGFRSMLADMTRMLADFFARWMIQQAAMSLIKWFTGAMTGSSDPIGPGLGHIYHSGGMVGAGGAPTRAVPMSLFAGAPRFHKGGLLRGEVPIIAERGEAVFTPEQMNNADRLINAAMGSGGTTVNVNNDITVSGHAGGSPEADRELAQKIGKHVENSVRAAVTSELRQQMRPGGMLNGGGGGY